MPEHTHLYLVSNQATPNLTPALDPSIAPRRVILLVSPDMRQRADWLEAVLKARGIGVERWPIQDAWDVAHIQLRVLELLEAEQDRLRVGAPPRRDDQREAAIALNATGGTKPMSIAAYEAFRAYELPIFYVHPEHDRLIWMHPPGREPVDIANRVRIEAFLQAHGSRVQSMMTDAVPAARQTLGEWLVANQARLAKPVATLNWLAQQAEQTLRTPALERRHLRDRWFATLVDHCVEARLLTRTGDHLSFPDEAARFYLNGGWLEEHVFTLLRGLRAAGQPIQDLARSINLYRLDQRGAEVRNEIDVACLAENRMYLVECKTRRWNDGDTQGPGAEALYRLDTLVDLLGGLQARGMLVSYQRLPAAVMQRASDLRIQVCAGPRLPELHSALTSWLG
ncbi:DUF1887 family protein [Thiorhodococcus mannitoliphagus]|uniref:DUF1887 family protein n=1 Tax=Thiorhodococcus mannitoliphagus TaxID=329406 RepID=A0A6P1DVR5_9GAMM|nr:DUF1887 family CARF protein [Thiorhodococcus mannitoliphagus]NEX22437.1 DUF1887 family protein [Thiorhodococcus mannitoliphagus]